MLIFYTYDNNNLVCKDTILYLAYYFSYLSSCIDKQGVKKPFLPMVLLGFSLSHWSALPILFFDFCVKNIGNWNKKHLYRVS